MKPIISSILLLLLFGFQILGAQEIMELSVHFDSDQYQLDLNSQIDLDKFTSQLANFDEYKIEIIGHTDQDGSEAYNLILSEKRAEHVKTFFTDKGLSDDYIKMDHFGESQLITNASDGQSKSKNRRVMIKARGYNYETTYDMLGYLNEDEQTKKIIAPESANTISLPQGTQINIPPNAFCHMDGSEIQGPIEFIVQEAYTYLDMLDAHLSTRTADQILETGGMVYLEARSNGKEVRLKEGKLIDISLPTDDAKNDMQLFTGVNDADNVIWEETGEEIEAVADNSDRPFVDVDLSPILNFKFERIDTNFVGLGQMPRYPHEKRKAYPPAKIIYLNNQEAYDEAYKQYEETMGEYHAFEKVRSTKLTEWNNELNKRNMQLNQLKINAIKHKLAGRILWNISKLDNLKDSVSHDQLVQDLFKFMDKEINRIPLNERHLRKQIFGENLYEVLNYGTIHIRDFSKYHPKTFFPEFSKAINSVEAEILAKKIELGIVDQKNTALYIVRAGQLGWINCDRFIQILEEDKTELEFAKTSDDTKYFMIFKDIKSLITPKNYLDKVVFEGIPKGEEVRILAIDFSEEKAKLAYQDLTLGSHESINLKYKPTKIGMIKSALEDI